MISSRYDFKEIENRIYDLWQKEGYFEAAVAPEGQVRDPERARHSPYTVVIPPPNVTGRLHMGHALNNTIQDLLVRHKRMEGRDVLWVPGTDHAGIATQTVVKKMLDAEGIDYRSLGRENFNQKIWEWKEKYGDMILDQLRRIGCSCDWSRSSFTMDPGPSRAVNRAFKALYDEGYIYKGKRIVNWCPVDRTALSDDEVETKEVGEPGYLWHIRYPLIDNSGHVIVATTRPETLFGDTAVAVHPEDERYRSLVGKAVILPLQEKEIPVIADQYVDRSFGTGCLKITPAHDPNDFEVGMRHGLPAVNVMKEDASMNENVPPEFQGLSRETCREKTIAALTARGLLEREEPRMTPVGRSYRSRAVIEYRLSDQWFVKMKPLAEKTLRFTEDIHIRPDRWIKVYRYWLENIRDWCISRQIWWGHRIPAWIHFQTGEILVNEEPPRMVREHPEEWKQETDVLDTWFSSSLWPLSTLGWPEETSDLKRYFPTETLSTAKDILFFWVARMNMMAVHFRGCMPYRNVYFHPTVMDEKGKTMSKSRGNGIDPIHIIEGADVTTLQAPIRDARPSDMEKMLCEMEKRYPNGFTGVGADALRYTLIYLSSSSQELPLSMDSFVELGRRFTTKLWNAARFVLRHLDELPDAREKLSPPPHLEDQWIRVRFGETLRAVCLSLDGLDFSTLGQVYYGFVWSDFCDWYVETCKRRLFSREAGVRKTAVFHLVSTLKETLKILHPLIPFMTEELWGHLLPLSEKKGIARSEDERDHLIVTAFPEPPSQTREDGEILASFSLLQKVVICVRTLRKQLEIEDRQKLLLAYRPLSEEMERLFSRHTEIIQHLSGAASVDRKDSKPEGWTGTGEVGFEIYLDLQGRTDSGAEKKRLEKAIKKALEDKRFFEKKLATPAFLQNAPKEVVEKEREKQKKSLATLARLEEELANLAKER